MFSEVWDRLIQVFKEFCDRINDFFHQLDSMLEEDSSIWMLHRCRVCGRSFYTSEEAQRCVERHQGRSAKAFVRGGHKEIIQFSGKHIAPRNREGAMRRTEIRMFKQTGQSKMRR